MKINPSYQPEVSAAARLAVGQYAFAEGLRAAVTAGLDSHRVGTLLGIPEPIVRVLWRSWNLDQE